MNRKLIEPSQRERQLQNEGKSFKTRFADEAASPELRNRSLRTTSLCMDLRYIVSLFIVWNYSSSIHPQKDIDLF